MRVFLTIVIIIGVLSQACSGAKRSFHAVVNSPNETAIPAITQLTFLQAEPIPHPVGLHLHHDLDDLSKKKKPSTDCVISNVHIALGNKPTQMVVSYKIDYQKTVPSDCTTLRYGTNKGGPYENTATAVPHSYYVMTGLFVDIIVDNLQPGTKYYYIVGPATSSTEHYFTTAPKTVPEKVVYAVYGDMGIVRSNTTLVLLNDLADQGDLDVIVHMGDISYSDDRVPALYESVWDEFLTKIEPVASRVPYMTCPGNHEYPYNYAVYKERFRMPGIETTGTNMYYSWDYNNVHWVAISTEPLYTYIAPGTEQYRWLAEDLEQAAARKAKGEIDWILVFGHRPLYCSYNWSLCCNECKQTSYSGPTWDNGSWVQQLRANIETLLVKFGVDLYLSGHIHSYERMLPVHGGIVEKPANTSVFENPQYPIHIVSGAAGCMEAVEDLKLMDWAPPVSVMRDKAYGFGKLSVFGAKELLWQFIGSNGTYVGNVIDEFKIVRK